MRLWTVHPTYVDARGLVALWREALLAQEALRRRERGCGRRRRVPARRSRWIRDARVSLRGGSCSMNGNTCSRSCTDAIVRDGHSW